MARRRPTTAIAAILTIAQSFLLCAGLSAQASAKTGGFLADVRSGCKVWYSKSDPELIVAWNGKCENGLAQGEGMAVVLRWGEPVTSIRGIFHDGKLNGRGGMDGYIGQWRDGLRDGQGLQNWCTVAGCRKYTGDWKDDKPDGQGTYSEPGQMQVWSGTWRNGCFNDGDRRVAVVATPSDCGFD